VTSERLYDHQREVIQRVFGCPVANGYGGRDAGFIAHECPSGGLHLSAEDIVVETVDSSGHRVAIGEPGEIVITHMATRDFPFIRYRTGDIGVLDYRECACGRGLPLLREIQGRTTDFIQAVNGTMMHGLALVYTVRDLPGVVEFKIIQHALDRIEVLLVTDSTFDLMHEDRIVRDFKARLGRTVQVTVRKVDRIEPEKSGKFRYVISHVPATRADEKQAESA
jgi:phenylacetate-CoA ligase